MDKPLMLVYSYKNNKDRVLPIPDELAHNIQKLEEYTADYRTEGNPYLFLTIRKGQIALYNQTQARNNLKRFINWHGIKDESENIVELTFHDFRHTVGSNAINSDLSPKEVMQMLGHESFHSTSLYAKVRNEKLDEDYKKIGFIGLAVQEITAKTLGDTYSKDKEIAGTLPDGVCRMAFEGEDFCTQFNKCLLCPKFITTPLYLEMHKQHLRHIQEDKPRYMRDSYICNIEKVNRIEAALIVIISELEELNGKL
ncbi:Integrase family protein (fragment) [uncultured Sporomusa sp.]|uniref:Integrase family protein n=2 Tax=uncultured Sporomusa sp. TaxID=307249 RepID=A0A212LXL1_9FIRM